jgi:hypothetical protein
MKNNVIRMFLAVSAACVGVSALDAQSNELSAKVPFAFQEAGKAFPAGKYLLRDNGMVGVTSLQNSTNGESVFVVGADHALSPTGQPKLVFHCYAAQNCFLAEIRPRYGAGSHVPMTKAEKEIINGDRAREMASISVDLRRSE